MDNLNSLRRMNFAKQNEIFINSFMNSTPLFDFAPAFPTNNGTKHKYGKIISIPTGSERNFAGGYKNEVIRKKLEVMQLTAISHKHSIVKDMVDELDDAALAQDTKDHETSIGNETAKMFERREYNDYQNFAIANHNLNFYGTDLKAKLFDAGGTTNGSMYSIIFVSWKKDKIDIRFNPKMNGNVKNGMSIFKKDLVSNGALVHIDSYDEGGNTFKRYGVEILYDTSIDTLLNDPRMITAIVNINKDTLATADLLALMESALPACYPEEGDVTTMFYHHDLIPLVNSIKEDKLETRVLDNAIQTKYKTFNDAVLIKSRQMLKDQDVITVS